MGIKSKLAVFGFSLVVYIAMLFSAASGQYFNLTGLGDPQMLGYIESDSIRTLLGQRIVPVGDQNNDGYDDFLASELGRGTWLYYGGSTATSGGSFLFSNASIFMHNLGDLNSDSYQDFSLSRFFPSTGQQRILLFHGGPLPDTNPDLSFGNETAIPYGGGILVKDFDNDGSTELMARDVFNDQVVLFQLGADSDSLQDITFRPPDTAISFTSFGESAVSADFNGDGFADIAINGRYAPMRNLSGLLYLFWGGPTFDTIPDLIIRCPATLAITSTEFWGNGRLVSPGDVNGDLYPDLVETSSGSSDDSMAYVYLGGPGIDSLPDLTIPRLHSGGGSGGDLNGDNKNDLLLYLATSLNDVGYVAVYLGGQSLDSLFDYSLSPQTIPHLQSEFGTGATGIGDFNNDGINDFAFSAVESNAHARIYIYSGFSPATDVIDEPSLTKSNSLRQNYPNPFNPGTTIAFNTGISGPVQIVIFNIEGQHVRNLVDEAYPAGDHKVYWDGRSDYGIDVASGVYLYRIEVDGSSQSRKMLLLR